MWLGHEMNKRKSGAFWIYTKGKVFITFSGCATNVLLYCIFRSYSHSFYGGRNDFQSNFSPGIFGSSVYLSQPYTSVLHTNLIQLGDNRQWLTPPQAQRSAGAAEQYQSVFSSITGCQILLKVFTHCWCGSPCFQKGLSWRSDRQWG